MPTYPGESFLSMAAVLGRPDMVPNLGTARDPIRGLILRDSLTGATDDPRPLDADALVSPEPLQSFGGESLGAFEELFEKAIVTPREKAVGFVLADVTWPTSVWNTHRSMILSLTGTTLRDSGNVRVDNPLGYPLPFAPLQGRDLTTVVPRDGDATIQAVLTFLLRDAVGALEGGTDLAITGSRTIAFQADPDWSEPFGEAIEHLTDLLASHSGHEQRIALRSTPRTRLTFRLLPETRRGAAGLEALIYGWQSRSFGVPFWPDAAKLTAQSPLGSTAIACDTRQRRFTAGGLVMLWRDFDTTEVATILAVSDNGVTTTAPLNAAWPGDGRTYAIPTLVGRWDGDSELSRLAADAWSGTAAFVCETTGQVAPAVLPQVYGHDVLEMLPNLTQDRAHSYSRLLSVYDSTTGPKPLVLDRAEVAHGRATGLLWTLGSRDEITACRAWLALRRGRLTPFWLPSGQHDLVLAADVAPGSVTMVIQASGYTRYQFPAAARRYLCVTLLDGSGTRYYRRVTAAVAGVGTETLTLDAAFGPTTVIPAGRSRISFLHLVRLASDAPELQWHTRDTAEIALECVELPGEVAL